MRVSHVTTDAFGAFIVPYRCVHCGFASRAKVHAYAEASAAAAQVSPTRGVEFLAAYDSSP